MVKILSPANREPNRMKETQVGQCLSTNTQSNLGKGHKGSFPDVTIKPELPEELEKFIYEDFTMKVEEIIFNQEITQIKTMNMEINGRDWKIPEADGETPSFRQFG